MPILDLGMLWKSKRHNSFLFVFLFNKAKGVYATFFRP